MPKPTPKQLGEQLCKALGTEVPTYQQLWALVIFAKYVRLRARSNSAFNNLMNGAFPHARFRQITKFHKDGSSYPGLEIVIDGEAFSSSSEEDGE